MEACEQKPPVIQYFDILPQTVVKKWGLYWGLTVFKFLYM